MASQVTLDNIALDLDPDSYTPFAGRRRGSTHRLISGGTVHQDRGINPADLVVQFTGLLYKLTTVQALYALYRKQSHTFNLVDFKGNTFVVRFTPGVESFMAQPLKGSNIAWQYSISLSVVSVTTWLNGTFPPTT